MRDQHGWPDDPISRSPDLIEIPRSARDFRKKLPLSRTQSPVLQIISLAQELNLGFVQIETRAEVGSGALVLGNPGILFVFQRSRARLELGFAGTDILVSHCMV